MPWDAEQELDRALGAARPKVPAGFADAVARRAAAASAASAGAGRTPSPSPVPAPARASSPSRRRAWRPAAAAAAFAAAAAALLVLRGTARPADACVVAGSDLAAAPVGARLPDRRPLAVPADSEVRISCDEGGFVTFHGAATFTPHQRDLLLERGQARIEGLASVATTWARVAGIAPDALIDIQLSTEETSMNATAVTGVILAATAGSVLTVHVLRGGAEVRRGPSEAPVLALRAGDSATVPADGPVAVARTASPPRLAASPPAATRPVARAAPGTSTPPAAGTTADGDECAGAGEGEGECDPSQCDGEMGPDCGGMDCSHCSMVVAEPPTAEPRVTVEIDGAPSLGRADARVVIVEFGDFQCPFCERAMSTVHALAETYPNDVRIVFKNFPLPGHKLAGLAAEAALAAGDQGKFWEMYDLLFANRENLDRASLESYATQLGLDLPRFSRALDQHTFAARVADDVADATAVGIQGIPTFLINGRVVQGALPLETLKSIVDEELRR